MPGYEPVADAFAENFRGPGEIGAACCVYVDGEQVVDLWGGLADAGTEAPWTDHTIAMVYSATKGLAAMCALLLAQLGELDLDRPVAAYWPEFAAGGKDRVTTRQVLSHQAGLPVIDRRLKYEDVLSGGPVVEALAEQPPVWEPGTRHGYHVLTYGWLVGEIVRRVSGESIGAFFAREFARPLGLNTWIGLPSAWVPLSARGPRGSSTRSVAACDNRIIASHRYARASVQPVFRLNRGGGPEGV